jgi:hypothetical protein
MRVNFKLLTILDVVARAPPRSPDAGPKMFWTDLVQRFCIKFPVQASWKEREYNEAHIGIMAVYTVLDCVVV